MRFIISKHGGCDKIVRLPGGGGERLGTRLGEGMHFHTVSQSLNLDYIVTIM